MKTNPTFFNSNHFSTEKFPEVIAFCDRIETSHIRSSSEESYSYEINGRSLYRLKKLSNQWALEESENNEVIRVSIGKTLGFALMQGLRFSETDKNKQEERVNILFPVQNSDIEKALVLMYYYGGYPGNFFDSTPEIALIIEKFIDPNITFLSYSYVPANYLPWLREQLKNAGIIQSGTLKTLWVYKK